MNINQKLVEVRKAIGGFSKDEKGYNYKYVSGTQVLGKIINKLNELNLQLIPTIKPNTKSYEQITYTKTDKYGKEKTITEYIVSAEMEMIWLNAENPEEKLVCPWALYGQQDEVSKAFGSGLTYSERYFLLKFFGVPTDEDDPDKKQTAKYIFDAQLRRLYAIGKGKGFEAADIDMLCQKKI